MIKFKLHKLNMGKMHYNEEKLILILDNNLMRNNKTIQKNKIIQVIVMNMDNVGLKKSLFKVK